MCRFDPVTQSQQEIARHEGGAVKSLVLIEDRNLLLSGGWDRQLKVSDIRTDSSSPAATTLELPGKVYSMSAAKNIVAVAMSDRQIYIFDLRKMREPYQKRESSMKFQTRAIKMFPSGTAYALSSIEGRIAVEYIDPSPEAQSKRFAFKCHRAVVDGVDMVYPVHSLAFHPRFETFASGGGDGIVNIWDGFSRKRLRQFPRYPSSVAAMDFNCDGDYLAVASSYAYEEGPKDHPVDDIYIKSIVETDVKPK